MLYPEWLKKGNVIGVTACSAGLSRQIDLIRLGKSKRQFLANDFPIEETKNVRTDTKGRSASAKERAEELLSLAQNKNVRAVFQACGGDYLAEMLSELNFSMMKLDPKWYQGYSDATGLLFTLTTINDMATIYGSNFLDFAMKEWHPSLSQNLSILQGDLIPQKSFSFYQNGFSRLITGEEGYREDMVDRLFCEQDLGSVKGRMLGGCLDVLLDLCGTRFDHVKEWCKKYREDGVLWYFESFDLSKERLTIGLWKLYEAGWFRTAKGFLFGRPAIFSGEKQEYREAVYDVLGKLSLPIIFDLDIGHKPPRFTVINGALGEFTYHDNKGQLLQRIESE